MSCSETDMHDGPGCWKLDLAFVIVMVLAVIVPLGIKALVDHWPL